MGERVYTFLLEKHRIEVLLSRYLSEDSNRFDFQRGEIISYRLRQLQVMSLQNLIRIFVLN